MKSALRGWEGALAATSVLVVEDHRPSRDLLVRLLKLAGAEVREASSADEALADLARRKEDLLMSDLEMPGMSGFELVETIRKMEVGTGGFLPTLALSAYVSKEDKEKALRAGFSAHPGKPARPDDVIEAILELAGRGHKARGSPKS